MVDCSVQLIWKGPFRIQGPDGSITETSIDDGNGHLYTFVFAQNAELQEIRINRSQGGTWYLYSCEITTAN